jgi:hypothetical protein
MLELLYKLQAADLIEIGPYLEPDKSRRVMVLIDPNPDYQSVIDELKSLLGTTTQSQLFRITNNFLDAKEDEWDVRARSILSVLHYLSHNVEIPDDHKEAGLVTITRTMDGEEFNWEETPAGRLLKVRSKKWGRPDNAFVSVPYRGSWFYIADNDLNSKSTFKLLTLLFNLQAGHIRDAGPTLTLPVGGG